MIIIPPELVVMILMSVACMLVIPNITIQLIAYVVTLMAAIISDEVRKMRK
jgi:hypothetical protein